MGEKEDLFSCMLFKYLCNRCNPYRALFSEYQDYGEGNAHMYACMHEASVDP